MQAVVNYLFEPNENLSPYFPVDSLTDEHINMLWEQVGLNNLQAYETLHQTIYPLLFNYSCFILNDALISDKIIADTFVMFWQNRSRALAGGLKFNLVKHMRREILSYLSYPSVLNTGKSHVAEKSRVTLLTMLNSSVFKELEFKFLIDQFKLSDTNAALIVSGSKAV